MISVRVLAILVAFAAFYFASSVFIPLILSIFLFMLLEPLVSWGVKKGISRTLGSVVILSVTLISTGVVAWVVYSAFSNLVSEVPDFSKRLGSVVSQYESKIEKIEKSTAAVVPQAGSKDGVQKVQVVQGYGSLTGFALRGLGTIFDALAIGIFIPFLALFLLLVKPHLEDNFRRVAGNYWHLESMGRAFYEMIRSYFFGNIIVGGSMAIILGILFSILGLKNSVELGLVTGFLNLIPFVGPVLSLVFPIATALLQNVSTATYFILAGTIVTLHLVVTNLVVPKIIGSYVNVNAWVATLSLLVWGWLWGAIGLLIAVPMAASTKILLENQKTTSEWGPFFSEFPHGRHQPTGVPSEAASETD